MLLELSPEIIDSLLFLFPLVFLSVPGVGNINPFKAERARPDVVESPEQRAFAESLASILQPELGAEGLFGQAFAPGARANIFKSVGADVRAGFQRERKGIKKRFAGEEERGLRLFEEELLPAIRERAGAAGRGKSTGTAIGGIRAGESLLEQLAIGRQSALTESQTRQTDFFQSLDLLGASSEVGLLETILGIGTGIGKPAGIGQSTLGETGLGKVGGFISDIKPNAPCWVAIALWGEDAIKTIILRFWVMYYAPKWLLHLYQRFGPRLAKSRLALFFLRPIFEGLHLIARERLAWPMT